MDDLQINSVTSDGYHAFKKINRAMCSENDGLNEAL